MDTLFRLVSLQQQQQQQQSSSSSSDQYHQQQQYHYLHHQPQQSYNNSQISSFNNSTTTTTTSSSSSYSHHKHPQTYFQPDHDERPPPPQPVAAAAAEEECFNFFMDEDDFSSSSNNTHAHSSSPYNYPPPQPPPPTTTTYHHQTSYPSSATYTTSNITPSLGGYDHYPQEQFIYPPARDLTLEFFSTPEQSSSSSTHHWSSEILLETARAIAEKNTTRLQQLIWMLNEISSPYGDTDQKLTSYFLQALFSRMTDSGDRCYRTMLNASDKTFSFDSTRKMVLKFQEVSPWTTFGHVACNGAIIEALEGEPKLHIIDISNTFCTQWPTLLEAIATRTDDTPHLRLTTVVVNKGGGGCEGVQRVMREIEGRMEKFARLMGVPFQFKIIHHNADLSEFNLNDLDIKEDEAIAINCVNTLHSVSPIHNRRDTILSNFRRLQPRVITVVEEEAELDVGVDGYEFVRGFQECMRWFRLYFESLDESFTRTSNERLMLERGAGRALMDLLACPEGLSAERREVSRRWVRRMEVAGFSSVGFSDEVSDDVRALLKRYKEGWSLMMNQSPELAAAGMFLAWKDQPVVWASAWKPC